MDLVTKEQFSLAGAGVSTGHDEEYQSANLPAGHWMHVQRHNTHMCKHSHVQTELFPICLIAASCAVHTKGPAHPVSEATPLLCREAQHAWARAENAHPSVPSPSLGMPSGGNRAHLPPEEWAPGARLPPPT